MKKITGRTNITATLLIAGFLLYAFQAQGEEKEKKENNTLNSNNISSEIMSIYQEQSKRILYKEEKEALRRDPFSATSKLVNKRIRPAAITRTGSDIGFEPQNRPVGIPKMSLKGHLQSKDGDVVALLEIEGSGIHIVREGDTVGLHNLGQDTVIRIRKISRLHLVIESGSLGKLIIVR